MAYEDAETRSARAETRVVTLEAFSIAVPLRNLELCPLYSEGRCGKNGQIYEIGHFVTKPMPYEDAETRSARAETRSVTLEAFSIVVPLRNFELYPLYSEGRHGKLENRQIYEIGEQRSRKRIRGRNTWAPQLRFLGTRVGHTFSAFWLRSSVVSVLISLISDTLGNA